MKDNVVRAKGKMTIHRGHPRLAGNGKCKFPVGLTTRGKVVYCNAACACGGATHTECRCAEHIGVKVQQK